MNSTLRSVFVTGHYNDESFRQKRVLDNLNRLHLAAKIYLIIILWFVVINLVGLFLQHQQLSNIVYLYLGVYGIFIVVNLFFLIVFRPGKFHVSKKTDVVGYYEKVVFTYILISMLLGSVISLIDLAQYEHAMVFMMNMVICSSLFLTTGRQIFIPIALSTVVIVIGAPAVNAYEQIMYIGDFYNMALFVPISFFASRILYNSYCESYEANLRLQEEKETNQLLNQHLNEVNQQLEIQASIDELTKISNRRGFHKYLDQLRQSYKGQRFEISVIMMDVDQFKNFNDHYGHHLGDEVLFTMAQALRAVAKKTDGFVARWGGEEFVYIASGKNKKQVVDICKNIQCAVLKLKIPHAGSDVSEYVTLSLGASSAEVIEQQDIQNCVQNADKVLYDVKVGDRNSYKYFE